MAEFRDSIESGASPQAHAPAPHHEREIAVWLGPQVGLNRKSSMFQRCGPDRIEGLPGGSST